MNDERPPQHDGLDVLLYGLGITATVLFLIFIALLWLGNLMTPRG